MIAMNPSTDSSAVVPTPLIRVPLRNLNLRAVVIGTFTAPGSYRSWRPLVMVHAAKLVTICAMLRTIHSEKNDATKAAGPILPYS